MVVVAAAAAAAAAECGRFASLGLGRGTRGKEWQRGAGWSVELPGAAAAKHAGGTGSGRGCGRWHSPIYFTRVEHGLLRELGPGLGGDAVVLKPAPREEGMGRCAHGGQGRGERV